MVRFLQKIFLFAFFSIISFLGVFLLENGTADPYYQRFVSPKQNALILGNSKAAQGIMPKILNQKLSFDFGVNIYNYAFSLFTSPYGPSYTESIKDKLSLNNQSGYFIVSVDPWSISNYKENPNDELTFIENKDFISFVKHENNYLNINYLIRWFRKSFYEILLMRVKNNLTILHEDGWLEAAVEMSNESITNRTINNEKFYCRYLNTHTVSESRILYLIQLLEYLKSKGDVYLIRMPLEEKILSIDNTLDPMFNDRMRILSSNLKIRYYDFNSTLDSFNFKDGVHLTIDSAEKLSIMLSDFIIQDQKTHE